MVCGISTLVMPLLDISAKLHKVNFFTFQNEHDVKTRLHMHAIFSIVCFFFLARFHSLEMKTVRLFQPRRWGHTYRVTGVRQPTHFSTFFLFVDIFAAFFKMFQNLDGLSFDRKVEIGAH